MSKGKKTTSWRMQALTNIISITMVLILLGLVLLLVQTAHRLGNSAREDLTVTVVLNDGVAVPDAMQLKNKLQAERYVSSLEYISSEQALKEQVNDMGMDPTEFLGANPFSISMEMRMKPDYACKDSLRWISKELKANALVADVIYQQDLVESLNDNLQRLSLILLAAAVLLVIVSLSLINSTVRLSVYSHRFTIYTMKLVGAKWGFIRWPFVWRSFWIGAVAAALADAILFGCVQWAAAQDAQVLQYVTPQSLGLTSACVFIIGLLITMLCTFVSVTRYLRMRESDLY